MWVGTPLFVVTNDRSAVKGLEVASLVAVAADPCVTVTGGVQAIGPELAATDRTSGAQVGFGGKFGVCGAIHWVHHRHRSRQQSVALRTAKKEGRISMSGRLAGAAAIFVAGFLALPIALGIVEGGATEVFTVRMDLWWPEVLAVGLVLLIGGLWLVTRNLGAAAAP